MAHCCRLNPLGRLFDMFPKFRLILPLSLQIICTKQPRLLLDVTQRSDGSFTGCGSNNSTAVPVPRRNCFRLAYKSIITADSERQFGESVCECRVSRAYFWGK